jgi:hypothetical protein
MTTTPLLIARTTKVLLILPLLCPKPFPQQTRYDRQAGAAHQGLRGRHAVQPANG